jgi:ribonuclease D
MMAGPETLRVVTDIPDKLLETYLQSKEIAVDTELQGLRLQRDQVCLVQLCDRSKNVCLLQPPPQNPPPNLKKLLTHPQTIKVFHFALSDVAFLKTGLGVTVRPFRCTKVMSKLIRTYTEAHGLRALVQELMGIELDKELQTSNWSVKNPTQMQLRYAANDVLYLLPVYDTLMEMLENRGTLPSGTTALELNEAAQACLPTIVDLIINGYGDRDDGWESSLFVH